MAVIESCIKSRRRQAGPAATTGAAGGAREGGGGKGRPHPRTQPMPSRASRDDVAPQATGPAERRRGDAGCWKATPRRGAGCGPRVLQYQQASLQRAAPGRRGERSRDRAGVAVLPAPWLTCRGTPQPKPAERQAAGCPFRGAHGKDQASSPAVMGAGSRRGPSPGSRRGLSPRDPPSEPAAASCPLPPAPPERVSRSRWCFCILKPIINCL